MKSPTSWTFLLKECAQTHWSRLCACVAMLRSSRALLIPHLHVVFVRVSVGVCSAWAVGGVVVMESVLCDLWAGLQDAEPELCERERGPGMPAAWDSDQTLQHSRVSWLVASPFTWRSLPHTRSLSLHLGPFQHVWFFLLLLFVDFLFAVFDLPSNHHCAKLIYSLEHHQFCQCAYVPCFSKDGVEFSSSTHTFSSCSPFFSFSPHLPCSSESIDAQTSVWMPQLWCLCHGVFSDFGSKALSHFTKPSQVVSAPHSRRCDFFCGGGRGEDATPAAKLSVPQLSLKLPVRLTLCGVLR